MKVVWYGHRHSQVGPSEEMMEPVGPQEHLKPTGGLWTSPHDSVYGWKEWCQAERMDWLGHRWLLDVKPDVKLLVIDSMDDLDAAWERYPHEGPSYIGRTLDFEAIAKEYDGVWLTADGQWKTRHPPLGSGWLLGFYGWDCETIWWTRWSFTKVRRTRKEA
jgi:hypothetical protein